MIYQYYLAVTTFKNSSNVFAHSIQHVNGI